MSADKFTWSLPEYEGSYDADVEATVHRDRVEFTLLTRNPMYGGGSGLGTLSFEELLANGPPEPLSRNDCAGLLDEVKRRLAKLPAVTDPGPQFLICPSCDGERVCWLCKGTGQLSARKRCEECLGRKYCIGCDGGGVIAKGSA